MPDVYIISPFKTVVDKIKEKLNQAFFINKTTVDKNEWINTHCGTVHTFQGKEANEVIFALGCDQRRESKGAIKWVNENIVNVAVTRGKYRLYVLGDYEAWKESDVLSLVYSELEKHNGVQIK